METIFAAILGFFAYPLVVTIVGVILSVLFIIASEHEDSDFDASYGFAGFFAIIAAILYHKPILAFFHGWTWYYVLLTILAYGAVGGLNSLYRWFKYCRKYVRDNPPESFERDVWTTDSRGENKKVRMSPEKMREEAEERYRTYLSPSRHYGRIMGWIIYWPWSLLWNLLGDFFTSIYESLASLYKRIATSAIKRAIKP